MRTFAGEGVTQSQLLHWRLARCAKPAGCLLVVRAVASSRRRYSNRHATAMASANETVQLPPATPATATHEVLIYEHAFSDCRFLMVPMQSLGAEVQGGVGPLLTKEQLERIAEASGRQLRLQTLGPFYRISCCSTSESHRKTAQLTDTRHVCT